MAEEPKRFFLLDNGEVRCLVRDRGFKPVPSVKIDKRIVDEITESACIRGHEVHFCANFMMYNKYHMFIRELCGKAVGCAPSVFEFIAVIHQHEQPPV